MYNFFRLKKMTFNFHPKKLMLLKVYIFEIKEIQFKKG